MKYNSETAKLATVGLAVIGLIWSIALFIALPQHTTVKDGNGETDWVFVWYWYPMFGTVLLCWGAIILYIFTRDVVGGK